MDILSGKGWRISPVPPFILVIQNPLGKEGRKLTLLIGNEVKVSESFSAEVSSLENSNRLLGYRALSNRQPQQVPFATRKVTWVQRVKLISSSPNSI